jgi:tetratricopeptide (TPR) repeat protein
MTTTAVAERKRELAEAAGPFEAAKFRLLLHDFAGARQRAETILAANPNDPQALLLMAVLHDFWCLDQPDESLRWYRRLSAMEGDPSAIYTGLYGEFRINYTLKRWDQAIAAGERLLEELPHLYGGMTPEVERFLEYARKRKEESARQTIRP